MKHPAYNGCTIPNDYVDDTPAQAFMHGTWDECPANLDTCPELPGNDMVTNLMDYSDDQCRSTFTKGQADRMQWYLSTYLPTIRSMAYNWKCVSRNNPADPNSYATCISPCLKSRTPNHKPAPKRGWCYYPGGDTDPFGNAQKWGECICLGSPDYYNISQAPNTSQTSCSGNSCAVSFFTLNQKCSSPLSFDDAKAFCTERGYGLCTPKQFSLGIAQKAVMDGPCSLMIQVWSSKKCGKNSGFATNLSTGKTHCANHELIEPVCCFRL
jgi:hypothetical protein